MKLGFLFLLLSALLSAGVAVSAPGEKGHHGHSEQGKGKGHGQGQGKGHGHGPISEKSRSVIHELFANHEKVDRAVEETPNGYKATTTSADPDVAAFLKKHVSQMKARLEGGGGVRRWDPAFAEFKEHYDDLKIAIHPLKNGVSVSVTGSTPEAIASAQNHASIISGFIKYGSKQMHATHPVAAKAAKNSASKQSN